MQGTCSILDEGKRRVQENHCPSRKARSEFQRRKDNEREEIRRWFVSGQRAEIEREKRRERKMLQEQEVQSMLPTVTQPFAPPPFKKPKLDPQVEYDYFGTTTPDESDTIDRASSLTVLNEDILQSPPGQDIAVSAAQVIPLE